MKYLLPFLLVLAIYFTYQYPVYAHETQIESRLATVGMQNEVCEGQGE